MFFPISSLISSINSYLLFHFIIVLFFSSNFHFIYSFYILLHKPHHNIYLSFILLKYQFFVKIFKYLKIPPLQSLHHFLHNIRSNSLLHQNHLTIMLDFRYH